MAKQKVVDKWKTKAWYSVLAPEMFELKEIAQIPADEDSKMMGRRLGVSLSELTGDMMHTYTNLHFRVNDIKGNTAYTALIGHSLSPSYLRSLVRRRRDVINDVIDAQTSGGVAVRVKVSIYTARKTSGAARAAVRRAMREEMGARAKEMDFATFVQEIVFGKFSGRIYKVIKKIIPVKRIEIRKTEVAEKKAA